MSTTSRIKVFHGADGIVRPRNDDDITPAIGSLLTLSDGNNSFSGIVEEVTTSYIALTRSSIDEAALSAFLAPYTPTVRSDNDDYSIDATMVESVAPAASVDEVFDNITVNEKIILKSTGSFVDENGVSWLSGSSGSTLTDISVPLTSSHLSTRGRITISEASTDVSDVELWKGDRHVRNFKNYDASGSTLVLKIRTGRNLSGLTIKYKKA